MLASATYLLVACGWVGKVRVHSAVAGRSAVRSCRLQQCLQHICRDRGSLCQLNQRASSLHCGFWPPHATVNHSMPWLTAGSNSTAFFAPVAQRQSAALADQSTHSNHCVATEQCIVT